MTGMGSIGSAVERHYLIIRSTSFHVPQKAHGSKKFIWLVKRQDGSANFCAQAVAQYTKSKRPNLKRR